MGVKVLHGRSHYGEGVEADLAEEIEVIVRVSTGKLIVLPLKPGEPEDAKRGIIETRNVTTLLKLPCRREDVVRIAQAVVSAESMRELAAKTERDDAARRG